MGPEPMTANPFNTNLDKVQANYVPHTPLSFLQRSAHVYPDLTSVIYEERRFTWKETFERCARFASFLDRRGIRRGDTVAVVLPNVPAMVESHFSIPMIGAII